MGYLLVLDFFVFWLKFSQGLANVVPAIFASLRNNLLSLVITLCSIPVVLDASNEDSEPDSEPHTHPQSTMQEKIVRAIYMVVSYMWQTANPFAKLTPRVRLPDKLDVEDPKFKLPCIIFTILTVWAVWVLLRLASEKGPPQTSGACVRKIMCFGWFANLALLSPTLGLVTAHTTVLTADRYCYIPTFLVGVPVLGAVFCYLNSTIRSVLPWSRTVVMPAACVIIAILANQTRAYVPVWRNQVSLFEHAVVLDPGDYYAHASLGVGLTDSFKPLAALKVFNLAFELAPCKWKVAQIRHPN